MVVQFCRKKHLTEHARADVVGFSSLVLNRLSCSSQCNRARVRRADHLTECAGLDNTATSGPLIARLGL